ncbi:MAG TPA: hypothetical protein DIW27_07610 [Cytophagales bacterium]|nr:hypothetical protein [Cytophagales bacterium]
MLILTSCTKSTTPSRKILMSSFLGNYYQGNIGIVVTNNKITNGFLIINNIGHAEFSDIKKIGNSYILTCDNKTYLNDKLGSVLITNIHGYNTATMQFLLSTGEEPFKLSLKEFDYNKNASWDASHP